MFGEFLITHGIIDRRQLEEALGVQKDMGKPLGETLVHLGFLEPGSLDAYLEKHLLVNADSLINDPDLRAV